MHPTMDTNGILQLLQSSHCIPCMHALAPSQEGRSGIDKYMPFKVESTSILIGGMVTMVVRYWNTMISKKKKIVPVMLQLMIIMMIMLMKMMLQLMMMIMVMIMMMIMELSRRLDGQASDWRTGSDQEALPPQHIQPSLKPEYLI